MSRINSSVADKFRFEQQKTNDWGYDDWGWISPKSNITRAPANDPSMSHNGMALELLDLTVKEALNNGYARFGISQYENWFEIKDSPSARKLLIVYLKSLPLQKHDNPVLVDFRGSRFKNGYHIEKFMNVKEAILKLPHLKLQESIVEAIRQMVF